MKNLVNKIKNSVSNIVLFVTAIIIASMGLATMGVLAVFAILAIGLIFLAAPFIGFPEGHDDEVESA